MKINSMKKIFFGFLLTFFCVASFAQKRFYTKTGSISFFSKTTVENISAINKKVLCVWDIATGKIEFSALMKGFEFEKALMQEHFNESYVESDKYPKATFKGEIENSSSILFTTDKSYNVKVNGVLTIHGVSKQVSINAIIKLNKSIASATASFSVLLSDYNIKIPAVVSSNISKSINISISIPAFTAQ
jgi:hypothetical protein